MFTRNITTFVFLSSILTGCSTYNMVKGAGIMMDYKTLGTDVIFNSDDGSQYRVAQSRDESANKLLVCYQNSGIFSDTAEEPLRSAANEWVEKNRPESNDVAGESINRSGVWDSRTCYEFSLEQRKPIGAYLDQDTGEVVVVGESH